jgi:GNAT superfamily N-acetyltransferase
MSERVELRRASDADAEEAADVFISSRSTALPTVNFPYSDDSVRSYVRDILIGKTEGWVAVKDDQIVGIMSLTPGWVDQLYVATDWQGLGIGRQLLDLAKERSTGDLQLWTFQVNDRARRFYERNGFVIAELTDGHGNQEREPDVRYVWSRRQG